METARKVVVGLLLSWVLLTGAALGFTSKDGIGADAREGNFILARMTSAIAFGMVALVLAVWRREEPRD